MSKKILCSIFYVIYMVGLVMNTKNMFYTNGMPNIHAFTHRHLILLSFCDPDQNFKFS